MLGVDRFRLAGDRLPGDDVMPPDVTTLGPADLLLGAPDHQDLLDRARLGDGVVGILLQRNDVALAVAPVGGDEHLGLRVVDPSRERLGRKAPKDDGERRADAGAGEHRGGKLGDHWHVDRDPVALPHAELLERVRAARRLVQQVLVGDRPGVPRLPFPVERDLRPLPCLDVPVEAVLAHVELAVGEPLRVRRLPLEHPGERLPPEQRPRLLGPEALEVRLGALVDVRIRGVRLSDEGGGRGEGPVLGPQRVQRRFGRLLAGLRVHRRPPRATGRSCARRGGPGCAHRNDSAG